jgi:hypothetical protein
MKQLSYLVFLLLICQNTFAQQSFMYTYSDKYDSEGRTGIITSDSCYAAIGSVEEFIRTDTIINDCVDCEFPYDTVIYDLITPDILVVKTDYKGDTLWTKRIGAEGMDMGFTISETRDTGFILGGIDSSYKGRVIKLDKAGTTEWNYALINYFPEKIFVMDTFYIVVGTKSHIPGGDPDLFASCLNSEGRQLWLKEYGTSGSDPYLSGKYAEYFNAACLGDKKNIFLVGENQHDLIFYDIDFYGNINRQGRYGDEEMQQAVSICLTSDKNYVIFYNYSSNPYGLSQPRLLKMSETCNKIWEIGYFDYEHNISGSHLEITKDDKFIFSGIVSGNDTTFMMKTNNNGVPEWIRYFEYDSIDFLFPRYINETYDNGYFLVGIDKFQKLTMLKIFDENLVYNVEYEVITNLNDAQTDDPFTIFPNPATNYVSIELKDGKTAGLNITDLAGKTVFTKSLDKNINHLDISDLINGVYIVKLSIHDKTYLSKLIINRR